MKKSELERILLMAVKALEDKVIESNTPGMKFDKGTEFETRMKWMRALGGIHEITHYFRGKKALQNNCGGCKYYSGSESRWGVCHEGSGRKETMHIYDSCSQFKSKNKGEDKNG